MKEITNRITYNTYLDSEINYDKLETLKILYIKENFPLSDKLHRPKRKMRII